MNECDLATLYTVTAVISLLLALSEGLALTPSNINSIGQLIASVIKGCMTKDEKLVEIDKD